jgi:hypothetical protein
MAIAKGLFEKIFNQRSAAKGNKLWNHAFRVTWLSITVLGARPSLACAFPTRYRSHYLTYAFRRCSMLLSHHDELLSPL